MKLVNNNDWLLPDGVEDFTGKQAFLIEQSRRKILDTLFSNNYQLVIPPLIEYTNSLIINNNQDLSNRFIRFTEPKSGKTLGIRLDTTTQIARIVSNIAVNDSAKNCVYKICYANETLNYFYSNNEVVLNNPLQIGAEYFGVASLNADIEILQIINTILNNLGIKDYKYSLQNLGVYKNFITLLQKVVDLNHEQIKLLDKLIKDKSITDYHYFINEYIKPKLFSDNLAVEVHNLLWKIVENILNFEVINLEDFSKKYQIFYDLNHLINNQNNNKLETTTLAKNIVIELDKVIKVIEFLESTSTYWYFDSFDLDSLQYHNGLAFTILNNSNNRISIVAKGGRYNGINAKFATPIPATGFSIDLKQLLRLIT